MKLKLVRFVVICGIHLTFCLSKTVIHVFNFEPVSSTDLLKNLKDLKSVSKEHIKDHEFIFHEKSYKFDSKVNHVKNLFAKATTINLTFDESEEFVSEFEVVKIMSFLTTLEETVDEFDTDQVFLFSFATFKQSRFVNLLTQKASDQHSVRAFNSEILYFSKTKMKTNFRETIKANNVRNTLARQLLNKVSTQKTLNEFDSAHYNIVEFNKCILKGICYFTTFDEPIQFTNTLKQAEYYSSGKFFDLKLSLGMNREQLDKKLTDLDLISSSDRVNLVIVGIQLPIQYSSQERHANLINMKSSLPNFHIIEGFHSNNNSAINAMLLFCAKHDLYISPHYWNDGMAHITLGKPGIISAFFKVFKWVQQRQKKLVEQNRPSENCVVVVEDDYKLNVKDLPVLKEECVKLMLVKETRYKWTRFERYNTLNLYNIERLDEIVQMFANTTIQNPFDDYSFKFKQFFERKNLLKSSKWTKMKSTLTNQRYVRIVEWNSCLNKLKSMSSEMTSQNEELLCDFVFFKDNKFIIKPKGSKIKTPY